MNQRRDKRRIGLATGALMAVALAAGVNAQKPGPPEIAAKLSGSWKLNRELSPSLGGPARGGPGRGAPALMLGGAAAGLGGQRGGGRGGEQPGGTSNAELPPDVLAAQAAIRELQQIAAVLTVKATADSITFVDPRGEHVFAIDNKTAKLDAGAAKIDVKTRWDKLAVRQEFASPQTRLIRSWEMDDQDHLVLKLKVESMTLNSKEVKAVYDRQ